MPNSGEKEKKGHLSLTVHFGFAYLPFVSQFKSPDFTTEGAQIKFHIISHLACA